LQVFDVQIPKPCPKGQDHSKKLEKPRKISRSDVGSGQWQRVELCFLSQKTFNHNPETTSGFGEGLRTPWTTHYVNRLANIELTPDNSSYDGGSSWCWHVEGKMVCFLLPYQPAYFDMVK